MSAAAAAAAAAPPGGGDNAMTGTAATGATTPAPVTPMRRRYEGTMPGGGGVSPAATKPRLHELAVEPDKIERELTMSEVTYSLWQLKEQ